MKTTIITAALALSAALAYGSDYTVTTTGTQHDHVTHYGWCTNFDRSFQTATPAFPVGTGALTLDYVQLNIESGSIGGSLSIGSRLAIFTFVGDGTVGDFVGLSTNTVSSYTNNAATYTFSGVELDVTTKYQFLFVTTTTTESMFESPAEGKSLFDVYKENSGTVRTGIQKNEGYVNAGAGVYTASSLNFWQAHQMVNATYGLSVPEPATATLSLLALAGLAARRRRK